MLPGLMRAVFGPEGSEVAGDDLTIAKVQRSAGGLVRAGVGIMRVRARGARSGVGRKWKERLRYGKNIRVGLCTVVGDVCKINLLLN